MIRPVLFVPLAALVVLSLFVATTTTSAFVVAPPSAASTSCVGAHLLAATPPSDGTQLNMIFNNKNKKDDDLSYIETRDMTPAEMRALNAKNEEIMNAELVGMTVFSLVLSVPMLYLVWVGFFSETAGTIDDALPY